MSSIDDIFAKLPEDALVLFDFDGTMVYTEDFHWRLFHDVLDQMGIDYPFSIHHEVTGAPYSEIWEHLQEKYGIQEGLDSFPKITSHSVASDIFKENRSCYSYFPKAVETAISNNHVVGCVTANDVVTVSRLLNLWNLAFDFSFVYSTMPSKTSKVDVVLSLVCEMDKSILIFEDSTATIEKLKLASPEKITAVGVGHPLSFDSLQDCGVCDLVLDVRNECPKL